MIDRAVAREIVVDLNSTSLDGLDRDMQAMLRTLYLHGRREVRGEVRYTASVNTIATLIGKSRDTKVVSLYIEPALIEAGFVEVAHSGRTLTPAGVERARQLTQED